MDYRMPGGNGDECIRELKSRWPEIHILALTSSDSEESKRMLEAGAYVVIDKAHMELVIPAMYQIADRRESASLAAEGISYAADLSSQYGQLRKMIASMEQETARQLADQKSKLAERLDRLVVLKAVLVATRNPNYSNDQAREAISELVRAVLESDEHNAA